MMKRQVWAIALGVLAVSGAASAEVTSTFDGGTLQIVIVNGGDVAVTTGPDEFVLVNGKIPEAGKIPAVDVTRVVVTGDSGANTIDLQGINGTDFPNMTSCTVTGGGDADKVYGSKDTRNFITGGPGDDELVGGSGRDQFFWNWGDGMDKVDGGDGDQDRMSFTAGDLDDEIHLTEQEGKFVFTISGVSTSNPLRGIEAISIMSGAGNDYVVIEDLSGIVDFSLVLLVNSPGDDYFDCSAANQTVQFNDSNGNGNDYVIGSTATDAAYFMISGSSPAVYTFSRALGKDVLEYARAGRRGTMTLSDIELVNVTANSIAPITMSALDLVGSSFEYVNFVGDSASSRYYVTASDTITFEVEAGGNSDFDVLRLDALGGAVTPSSTQIDIVGYNSILINSVESIEYGGHDYVSVDRFAID